MDDMDDLIDELIKRNGGSERSCLAWCIGYISFLDREQNSIKKFLIAKKKKRL